MNPPDARVSANVNRPQKGPVWKNLGFADIPCRALKLFLEEVSPFGIFVVGSDVPSEKKPGTVRLIFGCDAWEQLPWPKNTKREFRVDLQVNGSEKRTAILLAEYKPLHLAKSELEAGASLDAQRAASNSILDG